MKKGVLLIGILIAAIALVSAAVYLEPWSQNQDADQHNVTNLDYVQANNFIGNYSGTYVIGNDSTIDWLALDSYPVACPDGTYVTQINDSIICSSASSNITLADLNVSSITCDDGTCEIYGNIDLDVYNITQNEGSYHCFNSTCGSYIYDNGTDLVIGKD